VNDTDCMTDSGTREGVPLAFGGKFDAKIVIALDGQTLSDIVCAYHVAAFGEYELFRAAIHNKVAVDGPIAARHPTARSWLACPQRGAELEPSAGNLS
jgi:hypothetical protein